MSAVTGGMEQGPIIDAAEAFSGMGFGAVRSEPRQLSSMHRNLTQTHWLRSALSWVLQSVKLRHDWEGEQLILRITDSAVKDADGVPYIPRNSVPWSQMANPIYDAKVWSEDNAKMACPSFDLPTGAPSVGGSCPGAVEGQSIIPNRRGVLPNGQPVEIERAICESCYVTSGPFGYTSNQLRQMLVHVWVSGMLRYDPKLFVETMVESIVLMPESKFSPGSVAPAPGGILPIRVHSAGDFFNFEYAKAWIAIANEVGARRPRVRFWAPTRTWVIPGWAEFWKEHARDFKYRNMTVRPSAFHFHEPAPDELAPGLGMGTSSLFIDDIEGEKQRRNFRAQGEEQVYFDWRCPTFSGQEAKYKSCARSPGPIAGHHCRACWVMPDWRVDYPAH